jgi:glutamate formiminotransferase/formiminotetrahydrofolate cyclodeaminase
MVNEGNPNSVTDAAVGALCTRSAIYGAYLNVRINAGGLKDLGAAQELIAEAENILEESKAWESKIIDATLVKMA